MLARDYNEPIGGKGKLPLWRGRCRIISPTGGSFPLLPPQNQHTVPLALPRRAARGPVTVVPILAPRVKGSICSRRRAPTPTR